MNLFKQFKNAAQEAGYEIRSYSGRAMYGKKCVGIVHDESAATVTYRIMMELVKHFTHQTANQVDDLLEGDEIDDFSVTGNIVGPLEDFQRVFESAREDGMGLSSIVYFTRLEWEDFKIDAEKVTTNNRIHWETVARCDLGCDVVEEEDGVVYAFNEDGEVLGEWNKAAGSGWHLGLE